MSEQDIPEYIIKGIEKAIEISKKCKNEDENPRPKVGAVLIKDENIIETAYRGEMGEGDHAEFTLLQKKTELTNFEDTILITTLEPCNSRSRNKTSCVEWIIKAGIKEVWIGLEDPNPDITNKGTILLRDKGITVQRFSHKYVEQVRVLCKPFWDFQLGRFRHDAMAISQKIKVESKFKEAIKEVRVKFRPYLDHCIDLEDFIDCLDERIPLIKDYNLFNFSLEAKEVSEKNFLFNILDYQSSPSQFNFGTFFRELINENKRLVILKGSSGIGKSRLLKYLEHFYASEMLKKEEAKIPILIDLSYWDQRNSIYQSCKEKIFNQISITESELKSLLKENKFIILMDAFNEIKREERIKFLKDLTKFKNFYSDTNIIISMTPDTEFSFMNGKLTNLWMFPIKLEKFKSHFEKLELPIEFDEFLTQIKGYNLNELIQIPLFLNYSLVYLKNQNTLPSSKYEIINNLLKDYFEVFLKRKYNFDSIISSRPIWQETLENLSFYMHVRLEDNKIKSDDLMKLFSDSIENYSIGSLSYLELNINDLIEFFINYNVLKFENDYYKFTHDILFEYYSGLKLAESINNNKKLDIKRDIFHQYNLKNSLVIAFPLINNKKFISRCKKRNKFIYIEGILEKNHITDDDKTFATDFLLKKIDTDYYYFQKLVYPLIIKLLKFSHQKEDILIEIIENTKARRFKGKALLKLGSLKSNKAKQYLLTFKGDPSLICYRGVALCAFEDKATQEFLVNGLGSEWYGTDYPSMIAQGLLKLQKKNKLVETVFEKIFGLFISPPEKLKFSFKDTKEYKEAYLISHSLRKGLRHLLIEKNNSNLISQLIGVLDFEKFNYLSIIDVIGRILDEPNYKNIITMVFNDDLDIKIKIPLIEVVKRASYKLDFKCVINFLENLPTQIEDRQVEIYYSRIIELLSIEKRFINYNQNKLIEVLRKTLYLGPTIQRSVVKAIIKINPSYFFEEKNKISPIYYGAYEEILNVIKKHKMDEFKQSLIENAKKCIPNWMYGTNKAFHNFYLFFKILDVLMAIDGYSEVKELFWEFLNQIDNWENVNHVPFVILNNFENSDKMLFIKKIYHGYSQKSKKKNNFSPSIFIGSIQPFDSDEFIDLNLQILKEYAISDYLLADKAVKNLIYLNPVNKSKEIFDVYTNGVHDHLIPLMLRLISAIMPNKSLKINKRYLKSEDWLIKNTAFDEIHKIYSIKNELWYNDEE